MTRNTPRAPTPLWAAVVCAVAGAVVFHGWGNPNRGYIDTSSLFYWWGFQWVNPGSESQHGWLILALSGWLFWRNLRRSREKGPAEPSAPRAAAIGAAVAAMIGGLMLHALGYAVQQARVSIVALLVFIWGVLTLAGGRRWGRAATFPLGFMLFALPLNVLDDLGFFLRLWVLEASVPLAHLLGIDVVRNGTQLISPDGAYQYDVAAACSGVRSLLALAALSLLLGYLNVRTWWLRAALLLLCVPLAYVGNVVRLTAIILAGEWGGQAWGERAHEWLGWLVFAVVIGGVLAVVCVLERVRPQWMVNEDDGDALAAEHVPAADGGQGDGAVTARLDVVAEAAPSDSGARRALREAPLIPQDGQPRNARAEPRGGAMWVAAGVAGVAALVAVALASLGGQPLRGDAGVKLAADGANPVELPSFLGTEWVGRRAEVSAVEREVLPPDTGYSRKHYIALADPTQQVFLSIVLSGRDRTSIHRPELCLVGQGWTVVDSRETNFAGGESGGAIPATLLRVRREAVTSRGREIVPELVAYCFVDGDGVVATSGGRMARDVWKRVRYLRADRWAYVLLQTHARDGEAAALARMQTVFDQTRPVFLAVGGAD